MIGPAVVKLRDSLRARLDRRRIRAAAEAGRTRMNIGAQTNAIPGWINVDITFFPGIFVMDATRPWPVPEERLDAILCEHMIEHVPKPDGKQVLEQAFRALRPGGVIRLIAPDAGRFARMFLNPESADAQLYLGFLRGRGQAESICDLLNVIFYSYEHRYIYSPEELETVLTRIGFTDIRHGEAGAPIDPVFENAEGHPKLVGHAVNCAEAFAIEARKPALPG